MNSYGTRCGGLFRAVWLVSGWVLAMAATADVDVTGVWAVAVDVPSESQSGTPRLELNQMGASVGGIYRGQFGERPVIGHVNGREVMLNFVIVVVDERIQVTYLGAVSGDYIQGSVRFGDVAEGTFTAQRTE